MTQQWIRKGEEINQRTERGGKVFIVVVIKNVSLEVDFIATLGDLRVITHSLQPQKSSDHHSGGGDGP